MRHAGDMLSISALAVSANVMVAGFCRAVMGFANDIVSVGMYDPSDRL